MLTDRFGSRIRQRRSDEPWMMLARVGFVFATGAAAAYFLDPDRGKARRAHLRDRVAGKLRRTGRRLRRWEGRAESDVRGKLQALAVVLRGEVDRPEQIRELEERTKRIRGVRDVESLLHLPKTLHPTD